jgi:chemotaxis protein methyltransferase CheR
MTFYPENLALPNNVFIILRNLIMENTGIYFDDSKKDVLADKLSNRVLERGFTSMLDYYYLLKYDDNTSKDEWARVFDLITVNETYFWREYDQIDTLVNFVLPEFETKNPYGTFRIWCAACSSGEEPLSIAIALDEAGWLSRLKFEIIASDASFQIVEKARSGLYGERSMRMLPAKIRDKYFTAEHDKWRIRQSIHQLINWKIININDRQERSSIKSQDVIFCRNVFIYFGELAIKDIVDDFYYQLSSPGYLFIGVSESLFRIVNRFELKELGKTFVYKKT